MTRVGAPCAACHQAVEVWAKFTLWVGGSWQTLYICADCFADRLETSSEADSYELIIRAPILKKEA